MKLSDLTLGERKRLEILIENEMVDWRINTWIDRDDGPAAQDMRNWREDFFRFEEIVMREDGDIKENLDLTGNEKTSSVRVRFDEFVRRVEWRMRADAEAKELIK